MALRGDLINISLFDVLQTLHQNRQDGVLVVERDGVTKKLHISVDGVRIFFARTKRPLKLGEIFVRRGRINTQDVEILLLQQKQAYRPMGELLIESGKVRTDEVQEILQAHAEDEIYDLFTWESGTFAFHDGRTAEDTDTPLSNVVLDPAGLCLEAARRLDETERMRQTIPHNGLFFIRAEGVELDREAGDEELSATFDALAIPNSPIDLRDLVGTSLYRVLTQLCKLLAGDLVRRLDVDELVETGRVLSAEGDHERAARMFEEAHEMDPANREVLEDCIVVIGRLNDPRRLSHYYAALGQLRMKRGEPAEAIELLEQALRQNSDNLETLSTLRTALAQLGDQDRAREISLKIARIHSDEGDLEGALQACTDGLAVSPGSISLRFQRAQLYRRLDRMDEAREELEALARDAEASDELSRSRKAQDMLANCYRLLLKIDPGNDRAAEGLGALQRQRTSSRRKYRILIQASLAAAVLVVVGVVGLTLGGESPEEMLATVQDAYRSNDVDAVRQGSSALLEQHPDSEEAQLALGFLSEIQKRQRAADSKQREHERVIRAEFDEAWEEVRSALSERPILEGLSLVTPFLERLDKPHAAFLRPTMKEHFEYEFGAFLDRVLRQFGTDRQQLAIGEYQLRKNAGDVHSLKELEHSIARVRARNWTELLPQVIELLAKVAQSKQAGKMKDSIEAFRKMMGDTTGSFANLDALYFTVRRTRLRVDVTTAVTEAREQRLELLRRCEFRRTRQLYDTAYRKADAVTDEEPRIHFRELIRWLDSTRVREDMLAKRDEIDDVIATLAEVERLRAGGQSAAAYRMFRPLILKYPVIQFERRYKIPFLVTSTPQGGNVYLDGKHVGTTPLEVQLDIDKRSQIVLKRTGFADATQRLLATDPALTGELKLALRKQTEWRRTITGHVEAPPVIATVNGSNLLLLATSNVDLLAMDTEDGSVRWSAETGLLDRIVAPPVVAGSHAYVITVGGLLLRVRLKDGAIHKTRLRLPGRVNHAAAWDGKTLFVATENRRLVAIRGTKVVYNEPLAYGPTTPLRISGNQLIVGTAEGFLLVHDAKSGALKRRLPARGRSSFLGGVAIHHDLVVAGAEDGGLYAFDLKSGKQRWRYMTAGPVTAPPISGKVIFLPTRDGFIHAVTRNGASPIRYELDVACEQAPAVANGFLYAVSGTKVTAFDTAGERPWWEYTLAQKDGAPVHVIAAPGFLAVITSESQVIAFAADKR